jgi:hypothetical protein
VRQLPDRLSRSLALPIIYPRFAFDNSLPMMIHIHRNSKQQPRLFIDEQKEGIEIKQAAD